MSDSQTLSIVDQLMKRGVDVVVIGGHAVIFHGYLRTTEDIDLVFRRTPSNEERLYEVLLAINAFWISNDIDPITKLEITHPVSLPFIRENSMMLLGSRLGYIDLFDFVPGLPQTPFDEIWSQAIYANGRPFVSLDWLRRMKQTANRPQDQIDLQHLPR